MMTIFSFLLSLIKVPKECLLSEDYCLSEEAAIFFAIVRFLKQAGGVVGWLIAY